MPPLDDASPSAMIPLTSMVPLTSMRSWVLIVACALPLWGAMSCIISDEVDCHSDEECAPDQRCVHGGGVLVRGGVCVSDGASPIVDAGTDAGRDDVGFDADVEGTDTEPTVDADRPDAEADADVHEMDVAADADVTEFDTDTSPNTPIIHSVTATPELVDRGGVALLEVDATAPDGADLDYYWTVESDDWEIADRFVEPTEVMAPNIPEDTTEITVQVAAAGGGTTSDGITIATTAAADPVISDIEIDSDDWIEPGGMATVTAIASHPEGDSMTYEWSVSDGWSITDDGESADLVAPDVSDDTGTVTLVVHGEFGGSDTATLDVRTQDITPEPFGFDDQVDVQPETLVTSNAVEVDGFEGPVWAVCDACEVAVNGNGFTDMIDGVYPGDEIELRLTSSPAFGGEVTAAVEVGQTVSSTWSVTTTGWDGERTFSTCGQQGRLGPGQSQCDGSYSGTALDGEVAIEEGIQRWDVPGTATYRIEVVGARGGGSAGGAGARMRGDFDLEKGDELWILVGQMGETPGDGSASGGGGSFVAIVDDGSNDQMWDGTPVAPLIIAGGGGGNHGGTVPNAYATVNESGNSGGGQYAGAGGSGGFGGNIAHSGNNNRGGAGAGFRGDGEDTGTCASGLESGLSFLNGGEGGHNNDFCGDEWLGGFGGGGAALSTGWRGSGGGGGYSGGGGGQRNSDSTNHHAGGGGSFNDGDNQDNSDSVGFGSGMVTIDVID